MGALLGLLALVAVPFLLLAVALKVFVGLLILPFRIVGAVLHGLFGLVAGLFGLAAGGVGLLVGLLVLVAVFVLLPLAPLILLGGIVWLGLRAFSPAARPV
jgi:hypothetical protein